MAEYDQGYLAEQNLYGSNREVGASNSGGSGIGNGIERRYGGGGGGSQRQRGGRRQGGWNQQGGGGGYQNSRRGGGNYGNQRENVDPEEYNLRRTRDTLFRIGDFKEGADSFHPPSELFRLKELVEEQGSYGGRALEGLLSSFRIITTEQPHKTPLTAALLGFLTLSPRPLAKSIPALDSLDNGEGIEADDTEMTEKPVNFGIMLIKVLVAAFRSDLDARLWRNVRLLLHLFASLLPLGIIEAASLRSILLSFAAVLEEPGVTAVRGDRAAVCIIETMCRAGRDLLGVEGKDKAFGELDDLVGRVQKYSTEYRQVEIDLVRAVALKESQKMDESTGEVSVDEDFFHEESLDTSVAALSALKARDYCRPKFLASPLDLLPPPIVALAKGMIDPDCVIKLPDILVPPDDEFTGEQPSHGIGSNDANSHGRARSQRKDRKGIDTEGWYRAGAGIERGPRFAKWFKDTVPSPSSPAGVIMRSIFYDIIDLYQVNRKECARILFDSARWLRKGTFVCKSTLPESGIFGEVEDQWQLAEDGQAEGAWNLDEIIVECILSTALVLPVPPQKPLYYTTLLREVVTLNPQSVAPAMGKSVRRLYNVMNTGRVEGETIRRFAEWFSVHLSNFNFNWNWKEWIPDMDLPSSNPKMAFARRIVELEVRLAYYDRIKTTLPEEIQKRLLPGEEPAPSFTYGVEEHPYRERALLLIQSLRARATAEVILAELESFKKEISPETIASFLPSTEESNGSVKVASMEQAEIVVRDVLMQAVLSLGSRSFSHLLNVLEKYHPLLRQMTTSPLMRLVVLSSTARFWSKSPQWIQICVDKLLQYRLVEPTDVIKFVFSPPLKLPALILQGSEEVGTMRDWSSFNWWELIKLTVNKVNGRVDQVQKRLDTLEREESDKMEKQKAAEEAGDNIEIPELKSAQEKSKLPLFPSGVTTSTLPRRPDLPPLPGQAPISATAPNMTEEEKKGKAQTVEETRILFTNVVNEQRRVLIDVLQGFVTLLQAQNINKDEQNIKSSFWKRQDQQDNDDAQWQQWWLVAWYREYCRLFHKFIAANQETITANVFASIPENSIILEPFDGACQMASE